MNDEQNKMVEALRSSLKYVNEVITEAEANDRENEVGLHVYTLKKQLEEVLKPYKVLAVRIQGDFTEWYSPFYKDPYNDDPIYRQYYHDRIINDIPVVGPSLGEGETDENITDDLACLAERLCVDAEDWDEECDDFMEEVKGVFETAEETTYVTCDNKKIIITPYFKHNFPKVNEESLKVYRAYAELLRKRVENIVKEAEAQ